MFISVIIPVYNEEQNIPRLFERLNGSLQPIGVDCEFIFVNDGSSDRSMQLIRNLSKEYSFVRFIDFSRNFGHQLPSLEEWNMRKEM